MDLDIPSWDQGIRGAFTLLSRAVQSILLPLALVAFSFPLKPQDMQAAKPDD